MFFSVHNTKRFDRTDKLAPQGQTALLLTVYLNTIFSLNQQMSTACVFKKFQAPFPGYNVLRVYFDMGTP